MLHISENITDYRSSQYQGDSTTSTEQTALQSTTQNCRKCNI